jgi:hypothetical protein
MRRARHSTTGASTQFGTLMPGVIDLYQLGGPKGAFSLSKLLDRRIGTRTL